MAVPIGGDDIRSNDLVHPAQLLSVSKTRPTRLVSLLQKFQLPIQLFSKNERIGKFFKPTTMFLSACVFLSPRAAASRRKPKAINSHLTPSSWESSLGIF